MGTNLCIIIGRSSRLPRICSWLVLSTIAVIALMVPEVVESAMVGSTKCTFFVKRKCDSINIGALFGHCYMRVGIKWDVPCIPLMYVLNDKDNYVGTLAPQLLFKSLVLHQHTPHELLVGHAIQWSCSMSGFPWWLVLPWHWCRQNGPHQQTQKMICNIAEWGTTCLWTLFVQSQVLAKFLKTHQNIDLTFNVEPICRTLTS